MPARAIALSLWQKPFCMSTTRSAVSFRSIVKSRERAPASLSFLIIIGSCSGSCLRSASISVPRPPKLLTRILYEVDENAIARFKTQVRPSHRERRRDPDARRRRPARRCVSAEVGTARSGDHESRRLPEGQDLAAAGRGRRKGQSPHELGDGQSTLVGTERVRAGASRLTWLGQVPGTQQSLVPFRSTGFLRCH